MTIKLKKPLLADSIANNKSVDDKLEELNQEVFQPITEKTEVSQVESKPQEVIKSHTITHIPASEVEKNYQPKTVGVRVDIKKDLNRDLDLLCIDLEENKKDLIETALIEFVKREKKKLEK